MFWIILIAGIVLYFVLRGRGDRPEQLGAAHRPLPTGSLEAHKFPCPYAKCQSCGGSGEGMKQEWDGLRSVKWTCGYCGALAGVQELKDEELPPSARQRLGLDGPVQGGIQMQGGFGQSGGGVGDLLTGMMIGSMMGGGGDRGQGGGDNGGWGGDAGDASSSDWGESDSGSSDWGDSGGGDSGGDW